MLIETIAALTLILSLGYLAYLGSGYTFGLYSPIGADNKVGPQFLVKKNRFWEQVKKLAGFVRNLLAVIGGVWLLAQLWGWL